MARVGCRPRTQRPPSQCLQRRDRHACWRGGPGHWRCAHSARTDVRGGLLPLSPELPGAKGPVLLCHSFFARRVYVHWNHRSLSVLLCVHLGVVVVRPGRQRWRGGGVRERGGPYNVIGSLLFVCLTACAHHYCSGQGEAYEACAQQSVGRDQARGGFDFPNPCSARLRPARSSPPFIHMTTHLRPHHTHKTHLQVSNVRRRCHPSLSAERGLARTD